MIRFSLRRSQLLYHCRYTSTFNGNCLSLQPRSNGVAVIQLNDQSSKVNTLSAKMTEEFLSVLEDIEKDSQIQSVVLLSGKPGTFIAGADISQLNACKTSEELSALSKQGQQFLGRIAQSKKPFVAAIDGACLGGGLEVALACHYRIASQNPKTVLALPEVMLGLLPGAGGTQRLPRLVGLQVALDMMLTGKNIRSDKARKIGLVDQIADYYALESAAISAAEQIASGKLKRNPKKKSLLNRILEDTPMRSIVFKKALEMVEKKTGGHYPAPPKILETVQTGLEKGMEKGLEMEAKYFGKLGMTPEAKALISIFFGQTQLKKNRYGSPENPVKTIGVIGAGLMGAGIAQVSASKNYRVLLKDRDANASSRGESMIRKDLDEKVSRRRMTIYERDLVMSRVISLSDEDSIWRKHMEKADLVIEAVFEDMNLKHRVIQGLEPVLRDDCIIATNTSALSVAEFAKGSKHPENVIGMHYFSPVPKMPLLEIILHEKTSESVAARAMEVGLRQGKTCIVVKDVPGFYVNRCLGPYIAETLSLVENGVQLDRLDTLVTKWGLPVGPITLGDEVGIDVCAHVNQTLSQALGVRMRGGDPKIFEELVQNQMLGKKSGQGFYIQPKNRKEKKRLNPKALEIVKRYLKSSGDISDDDVILRLISRFVNEAILCVQDEIIASPMEGDIGAVFGIGFPPFIGGPFRFVDRIGSKNLNESMLRFADTLGEQFQPSPLLQDMAKTNKKFHAS